MRFLVTGPRGFVGARIMEELSAEAITAPTLRTADEDTVRRIVDDAEPDLIIHTAAISDIPTCEKDPEASFHANVEIPVWLARTGVRCVMFSTDQVYSGCAGDGPYTEEETAPSNLYSRHKLEMEQRTLDLNPDTVLLRATWMYDMPKYGVPNRGNFLVNMLRQPDISFSATQHRAVTYVREVSGLIRKAALLPGGVYNYGSENTLTMYQTAEWLKNTLSLSVNIHNAGFRHHLWMDCTKIRSHGIRFCNTIDGLKRCISDYNL